MTEIFYRRSKHNNFLENAQIVALFVYFIVLIICVVKVSIAGIIISLFLVNLSMNRVQYYRIRRHQNTQFEIMNSTINEIHKDVRNIKLTVDKVNRK